MKQTLRQNPVSIRKGEGEDQKYVKVRKNDGILLRYEKKMDWANKFSSPKP